MNELPVFLKLPGADQNRLRSKGVYIAGPMSGRVLQNSSAFARVSIDLREQRVQVFNPAEYDLACGVSLAQDLAEEARPAVLLKDLQLILNHCGSVVLLPDWQQSRGALLEASVARACGLSLYEVVLHSPGPETAQVVLDVYREEGRIACKWYLRACGASNLAFLDNRFKPQIQI